MLIFSPLTTIQNWVLVSSYERNYALESGNCLWFKSLVKKQIHWKKKRPLRQTDVNTDPEHTEPGLHGHACGVFESATAARWSWGHGASGSEKRVRLTVTGVRGTETTWSLMMEEDEAVTRVFAVMLPALVSAFLRSKYLRTDRIAQVKRRFGPIPWVTLNQSNMIGALPALRMEEWEVGGQRET